MTIGEIIKEAMPRTLNREKEIYKALLENDNESGTIEKILNGIEICRKNWTNLKDIYEQPGETLDKTLSAFSLLTRVYEETDKMLIDRHKFLFYRNGDKQWGSVNNLVRVYKTLVNTEYVYIVNNIGENDIIKNGDFELTGDWALSGCDYSTAANFSEQRGIEFTGGTCKQTITTEVNSIYALHYFYRGAIGVSLKSGSNYWKPDVNDLGSWENGSQTIEAESDDWQAGMVLFKADSAGVEITFSGDGMLDYVRCWEKEAYPSFALVISLGGKNLADAMSMFEGQADPVPGASYNYASYIEQAAVFGTLIKNIKSVYAELLDIVKPAGVFSIIELVGRVEA